MGADLIAEFPLARQTFEEASDHLGYDLARVCAQGSAQQLAETAICQPATLTCSVSLLRVAKEQGITGQISLGHSLGEYAALVSCAAIDFSEALSLVMERVRVSGEAVAQTPGRMVALLGASDDLVRELCKEAGGVWPANFNGPGQVVASGTLEGVERLLRLAEGRSIKTRPLEVEGAFHSPLMASARDAFALSLEALALRSPSDLFVSATSGARETETERLRALLSEQLTGPVRFTQAVHCAEDLGGRRFIEFGPRRVLIGLVKRILPDAELVHIGSVADLVAVA